ncbi:hypothetical protein ACWT_2664 [Actinoplanes sp. SE50]|uniref:SWIM zinc finger family protein n=1 Tax=unclassified Actinoplanes TaxID=2626549 RepID=UPI00023ECC8D|nr:MULTISPECIES: hypothetical protein [unclassified Actinoplanes]AEV83777.1 hypothetical protein ACPL_2882 [Actinoplanes sp. SE50/110]ATO82079.1 hypothetical protein ACWT_2664 [Actinoplanes sp. SE50]SLL99487.1 hypothetical protein ACSP50_2718 [Actinoplanes sp. SE50/110]
MSDFAPAFLGMFESLRMGPTFARGRRDERAGHVRSLTVSSSLAVALVRGPDDPSAFRSRIAVRAFGAAEWARVESALVSQARFVAGLLDGRMPPGVEAVFADAGLTLLPLSLDEVAMDCTCERWPMPCVHLAATCYALARMFEADPFEVFAWRGRHRDELLMRLRRLREAAAVNASDVADAAKTATQAENPVEPEPPLIDPDDLETFWGRSLDLGESPVQEPSGGRPDALLDQLDPPRIGYQGRPLTDILRPAFRALADTEGVGRSA